MTALMTLDEAIKHCEEVAYQNEILMKRYDDASGYNRSHNEKIRTDGAKGCEQLISLYRQLAEWLKELKELRDFANFVAESVMEEDFEEDSDVYAEIFCKKLYKMGFIEAEDGKWIFNKNEVNTDEDSN